MEIMAPAPTRATADHPVTHDNRVMSPELPNEIHRDHDTRRATAQIRAPRPYSPLGDGNAL